MATESMRGRSDEATLDSQPESAINIDANPQHDERPHLNGDALGAPSPDDIENKVIQDIVDDLIHSTEVSVSGGSDNEASKSDVSKLKDGERGHGRTSSAVKKLASFKAISVNKTFLTSKGATSTTPIKPSEKTTPSTGTTPASSGTLTASRPRLVAKSGSGLVAKTSGANGGKPGAAPDPNAVWNKNRPVPPPPPKNYTDEELKKYGIHMASRLQADDGKGGQANWADIDDDDEDWAPDTITWKDGTKVTIPHTEEHPPAPPQEPAPSPAPAPTTISAPRLVTKDINVNEKTKSPAPTPSVIVKPGVLASGKGLVLKGAPEKPTLVAKPPAPPTPVKSPWAPIPKVDKVSPVLADAPATTSHKPLHKDTSTWNTSTPPPHPPKEIAADDFSRAPWREGPSGAGRELYNSQSGRYEPVSDRRGSFRADPSHGARQPALLQRQNHDYQGAPDYTGSLQAGRPNEQALPYGRRRGSSNVSGGSGTYMQRLKTHDQALPPPEVLSTRRESLTGRSDSPASPRNYSPSGMQGGPRHAQGWPPRVSPALAHSVPVDPGAQQAVPPAVQPLEDELELQRKIMRERRDLAMKRRLEQEAKEEAEKKERIRLKLEALGPAPESNSAKKAAVKDHAATPTHIQAREPVSSQQVTPTTESATNEKAPSVSTLGDSTKSESLPNGISNQPLPSPDSVDSRPQPGSSHPNAWPNPPRQSDRYAAASWGPQPAGKNVWGAPNNNRTLGNGTFITDIGATQPTQPPMKAAGPGPIAPPSSVRLPPVESVAPAAARLPPIGPPKQRSGRLSAQERDAKQNAWVSGVRLQDDAFSRILNTQYEEREHQLQQEGRTINDLQPVIKDTWRPTKLSEDGRRDETAPKQSIKLGAENSWVGSEVNPIPAQPAMVVGSSPGTQGIAPTREAAPASILATANTTAQPTRGSRFFPTPRDRSDDRAESQRQGSPSPPPPDMLGHPAFDGDVAHPHVSLPKPPVVVRLPPVAPTEPRAAARETPHSPQASSQPAHSGWSSQHATREHDPRHAVNTSVNSQSWQAKFDSLLGGRKAHAGPQSPVVDAAAHSYHREPAPALPRTLNRALDKDPSVTTKVRDEECFEEQEMGSLPPVRLPHDVPENVWTPSPAPKPLPKKLWPIPSSAEPISFPVDMSGSGTIWRIKFPGYEKALTVPFGRSRSNPRRGGAPRGGRHGSAPSHPRSSKARDNNSSYANEQGASTSASAPSRGGRGGFRGGREGWNRSNPIQT
ncbi:hypothetical protein QBC47DRAFT_424923 [Echria macrotheca]|uniref:Uncharacterized protein n=1 Tax=Echria macrotheca TaxID=438768 RepID=A0AAJ0B699_9PEZI|nr:hypothetical protein QBC47DRAFT_424923 [Echria macrotheca]